MARDGVVYADPCPPAPRIAGPSSRPAPSAPPPQVVAYLDDAAHRGLISPATHATLRQDATRWLHEREVGARPPAPAPDPVWAPLASAAAPARVAPPRTPAGPAPQAPARTPVPQAPAPPVPAPPVPARAPAPTRTPAPQVPAPPPPFAPPAVAPAFAARRVPPPAAPRPPGPWARAVAAVSADLAVHGLAYLGVLLVFAGVFGFVAFAFADVQVGLRPVAEAAIPITFFLAAWLLRRRGSPVISAALELLGGALLPVVLIASLSDGAPVPPDLEGVALIAALAGALVLVAAAYAVVVLRRPDSALRFLVAPALWLAVAAVGLRFATVVPSGADLSHPLPAQWALVGSAIAATVWGARSGLRSSRPAIAAIARGTLTAAGPATVLALLLTLLASPTAGWPAVPIVVVGVAAVLALEGLAIRLDPRAVTGAQAATVYVAAAALVPALGASWAASSLVVAALALLEGQHRRRPALPPALALALWAPGLVLGVLVAATQPGPLVVVTAVGWSWAVVRHAGADDFVPDAAVVAVLAVAPLGFAAGLAGLTSPTAALLVLAGLVLLVSVAVRAVRSTDRVWAAWIPALGVTTLAVAVAVAIDAPVSALGLDASRPGQLAGLAGAAAVAGLALALAPRWPALRIWSSAVAFTTAGVLLALRSPWSPGTVALVAATVGLLLVVAAASVRPQVRPAGTLGHLGLIGHLLGTAAVLLVSGDDAPSIAVLAMAAAGWLSTTARQERTGSAVTDRLRRMAAVFVAPPAPAVRAANAPSWGEPGALRAAAGLPAVLGSFLVLVLVGAVVAYLRPAVPDDPAPALATLVTVVLAVGGARLLAPARRRLAGLVANTALVVGVVVVGFSTIQPRAAVAGAGLFVAAVIAVGPVLRRPYTLWLAWLASALGAVELARSFDLADAMVRDVVLAWGLLALVAALALDDRWSGRRAFGEGLRRRSLRAPVVLGPLAAVGAWLTILADPAPRVGWACFAAALAVLVVAWQLRWGALSALGWLLATGAYAALVPWDIWSHPWTLVPVVAALAALAEALDVVRARRPTSDPAVATSVDAVIGLDGPLPSWLARWDLGAVFAALAVAVVALVAAPPAGEVAATWCTTGALAIAVGLRRRVAAVVAAGAALVVLGATAAGWGWTSLALAGVSIGAAAATIGRTGTTRIALQVTSVSAAALSFITLLGWREADFGAASTATSAAVAVIAIVVAVVVDRPGTDRNWLLSWSTLGGIGLAGAALLLAEPGVEPSPAGPALAGALALTAVATARAARPLAQAWLRDAAAVVLASAAWPLAVGTGATPTQITVAAVGVAAAAAVAAAVLDRVASGSPTGSAARGWSVWVPPTVVLAVIALVVGPVAGAVAGAGWLSLALAEVAVVTSVAAWLRPRPWRLVVGAVGAAAAAGAWAAFVAWLAWPLSSATVETAVLAGAVAVVLGALSLSERVDRGLLLIWSAPVAAGLAASAGLLAAPSVPSWPAGAFVALGLATAACGAATAAAATGLAPLRDLTAGLVLAAAAALTYGARPTASVVVVVAAIAGTLLTVALATVETADTSSFAALRPWTRPGRILAGAAVLVSVAVATAQWPDRPLLVAALLLVGLDLAAVGVVGRRPSLLTASPVPIALAWLVFASDALAGRPAWLTVPVGAAVLAVVDLARRQQRRAGRDPVTVPIVALDALGCLLVVGAPLVQIVASDLAYGLLAMVLGAAVVAVGVVSRVRRRLVLGTATIALAAALMILVPLAGLVPQAGRPVLWLAIAAVGLVAIVVAAFIEQGRATVARLAASFHDLTRGWEGWSSAGRPADPGTPPPRPPRPPAAPRRRRPSGPPRPGSRPVTAP